MVQRVKHKRKREGGKRLPTTFSKQFKKFANIVSLVLVKNKKGEGRVYIKPYKPS
jgi:hypothetical protein